MSEDLSWLEDVSWSSIPEEDFVSVLDCPQLTDNDLRDLQNVDWSQPFDESIDELSGTQIGAGAVQKRRTDLREKRRERSNQVVPFIFEFDQIDHGVKLLPRFHREVKFTKYRIHHNLSDILDFAMVEEEIDNHFRKFLKEGTATASENDIVSVTISHESLNTDIFLCNKKKNIRAEEFLNQMYLITQSNTEFLLTGTLDIEIAITKAIQGEGKNVRNLPISVSEHRKNKKGLVSIDNKDSSCGYLAIALGKYYLEYNKPTRNERDLVRKNRMNRLTNLAHELCDNAKVDITKPLGIQELEILGEHLQPAYQLFVVNGITKTCDFKATGGEQPLIIELLKEHYSLITALAAYMDRRQFCLKCWVGYDKPLQHKCKECCIRCQSSFPCKGVETECKKCNKYFNGAGCLENHIINKLCTSRKRCRSCEVEFPSHKKHTCGWYECTKCRELYSETPHYCFIKRLNDQKLLEEDGVNKIIVSFDIESEANGEGMTKTHVPVLLISMTVCDVCLDGNTKKVSFCEICGDAQRVFYGYSCVRDFGDYLYKELAVNAHRKNSNVYVFAHNFRSYDGHFIMQDLFNREFVKLNPVMKGSKILKVDVGNVRFIDSLSFFQLRLAALPKSFGYEHLVLKGYFPHQFNTALNSSYEGQIPELKFFGFESMRGFERDSLLQWHSSFSGIYKLKDEMIKYCTNDVLILMQAVLRFRHLFREVTSLDPFTRNFTLASVGLETYRSKFLVDHTLGITPNVSYSSRNSSMVASSWLDWLEKQEGVCIKREYKIGKYWADGCIPQQKVVFEFWGCLYHGCNNCYPDRSRILKDDLTANDLFRITRDKVAVYQKLGFTVVEMWECDFKLICNSDERMKEYHRSRMAHYHSIKKVGNVLVRESFFGGRTNNIRFWCEAGVGESIEYKDVTSEYPYVLKNRKYPVGHPRLINKNFDESLRSYFGFVKCKILPPESLYLPVLPMRICSKLEFVLCRTCAENCYQFSCKHKDEDRALVGTWATAELHKALDLGYRVLKVYEVLHYENSSEELFKEYINMWLKIKQEASGWPRSVNTEDEKRNYINDYFETEGIRLEEGKIEKNPGKRFIAKLMLNSFSGKLAQRSNMSLTTVCKSYDDYWKIVSDDNNKVTGEFLPNDETLIVNHELKDADAADPRNTSLAISSFVTVYARLHLYKFLEKVLENGEDRLLYFDTDSLIFQRKEGDREVETGEFLGDLTDEIKDSYGNDARCNLFVSGGPKNYGYQVVNGKNTHAVIKTKGITTDAKSLNILTLKKMLELVTNYVRGSPTELKLDQWRISANKWTHEVTSDTFKKLYRVVSEKRRVCGNGTLPFGYKGEIMYS